MDGLGALVSSADVARIRDGMGWSKDFNRHWSRMGGKRPAYLSRRMFASRSRQRVFGAQIEPLMNARKHVWVPARSVGLNRDWIVCKNCGGIQNARNRDNTNCRGKVSVALRNKEAP